MNDYCSQLDDYLDSNLSKVDCDCFNEHLEICESCRREIAIANNLDKQLRSAWETIEAPISICKLGTNSVKDSHNSDKRRRLAVAVVAIAAAILVWISAAIWFSNDPNSNPTFVSDSNSKLPDTGTKTPDAGQLLNQTVDASNSPVVLLSTGGNSDAVLVQEKRTSPNFTIVKAYLLVNSENHSTHEYEENNDVPIY